MKTALTGWLVILIATSAPAQALDSLRGPPPGTKPLDVLMGFNLVNITDVGERQETLDFDGALYLEWNDPRLAYEPTEYTGTTLLRKSG